MTTTTSTLDVPGAQITYDVHGDLGSGDTPLLIIGAPMDASGFTTLVSHLDDRVLITLDGRNTGRSTRDEPTAGVSAEQHADDLHALVEALEVGPVDVFATSGGAVVALVLVGRHPEDVRTLVAHEPPLARVLPDEAAVRAACEAVVTAYDAGGAGPAMARFIALVMHRGEVPTGYADGPAPDPATFGMPTEDDGRRDDPLMSNMRGGMVDTALDLDAIRDAAAGPVRVVVAVGEESGGPRDGEMAGRSAHAVAAALGGPAVVFPGDHAGFAGGEHGQTGKPVEFAARLREVLAAPA